MEPISSPQPKRERTPLTFQLAQELPKAEASGGATARHSGGTTGGGGGPASEDANIDYD